MSRELTGDVATSFNFWLAIIDEAIAAGDAEEWMASEDGRIATARYMAALDPLDDDALEAFTKAAFEIPTAELDAENVIGALVDAGGIDGARQVQARVTSFRTRVRPTVVRPRSGSRSRPRSRRPRSRARARAPSRRRSDDPDRPVDVAGGGR